MTINTTKFIPFPVIAQRCNAFTRPPFVMAAKPATLDNHRLGRGKERPITSAVTTRMLQT